MQMTFRIMEHGRRWEALVALWVLTCLQGAVLPAWSQSGPAITTPPSSQTVSVAENATFTVVATGRAPMRAPQKRPRRNSREVNGRSVSLMGSSASSTPPTSSGPNTQSPKSTVMERVIDSNATSVG